MVEQSLERMARAYVHYVQAGQTREPATAFAGLRAYGDAIKVAIAAGLPSLAERLVEDAKADARRFLHHGDYANAKASLDKMVSEIRSAGKTSVYSAPDSAYPESLSPRELEVVALIVQGKINKDIGNALSVSERTIKGCITHIMTKLRLANRTQIAVYAVENGLISPPALPAPTTAPAYVR